MAVVGRDIIFPGRHGEQIAEGHCRGIPDCWHLPRTRSALPGPCERAAAPSPRGKTFQGYGFRDLKAGRRLGTPVKHSQFDPCRTRAAPPAALGWNQGKGASVPSPRALLPARRPGRGCGSGFWFPVQGAPRAAVAKGCWSPSSAPWEGEGASPAGCRTFLLQLLPREPAGRAGAEPGHPKQRLHGFFLLSINPFGVHLHRGCLAAH